MKQRLIATVATLVVLFFVATIGAAPISAQEETPIPDVPGPTPTSDLERRVYQIEAAQTQTIESLKQANEQNRFITTMIVGIITILVAVQGLATGVQLYREGRRDDRQADREKKRDQLDLNAADQVSSIMSVVQQTLTSRLASEGQMQQLDRTSIQQVSDVMSVVQQTLASRLASEEQMQQLDRTSIQQVSDVMSVVQQTLASRLKIESAGIEQVSEIMKVVQQTLESHLKTEEQAREMVAKAKEELEKSLKTLGPLQQFYQKFQATIKMSRQAIEEHALQLAQISRHDFRYNADKLNSFARQLNMFKTEFEALEEDPLTFSARVPYIRGIAAHYANQPENAAKYLDEVTSSQEREPDENAIAYDRRVANAYYYLGLTESNFGNNEKAIELFEKANELDLQARDFLTRVVTAEAYVMMKDFDKAQGYIDYVERRLNEIESEEGRLRNFHLRLRSRAALIRANIAILRREANWHQQVHRLLNETVYVADPQYYYATATLAQVYHDQGEVAKAQNLFDQAHTTIERSGHLLTVTETRSKVLLLMTAGICCKHSPMDEGRSEELLDKAENLLGNLPRLPRTDHEVCTVFSTLTKQNESSDTIRQHIELIRKGQVLL
jgi:tetratricopeptide (TPR) repeat protein